MLGWDGVPKDRVADLLSTFQTHPLNHDFQADALAEYLRKTNEPKLAMWDVRVPAGSAEEVDVGTSMRLKPRLRSVLEKEATSSILVSGTSARVGSPDDEREGMSPELAAQAAADFAGRTVSGEAYRLLRPRPLLVVNVLWPVKRRSRDRRDVEPLPPGKRPLVGLSISFPEFDDSDVKDKVIYKVNEILWRSLFEQETGDDFGLDDELD